MTETTDIFDKIGAFFSNNPIYAYSFLSIILFIVFLGCIFNWNWMFGKRDGIVRDTNIEKLQGKVYFFGRNTVRFFLGLLSLVILISMLIVIYYLQTK